MEDFDTKGWERRQLIRQYAAHALTGIITNESQFDSFEEAVERAVDYAMAMVDELEARGV